MKNSEKFDLRGFLNKNKIETGTFQKTDVVVEKKNAYADTKKLNEEVSKSLHAKAKKLLDHDLKGIPPKSSDFQWFVKETLKGALTDANFHSESKKVDSFFSKAKLGSYTWKNSIDGSKMSWAGKENKITPGVHNTGTQIAKMTKWDGHDIMDIFSAYVAKNIDPSIAYKITKLKEN